MEFIKKNFKFICIGGCLLSIVGCFLPFVSVEIYSGTEGLSYFDGCNEGAIATIICFAVVILTIIRKQSLRMLIPIIIVALMTINELYEAFDQLSLFDTSIGIGFIAIIVGFVFAILSMFENTIIKLIDKKTATTSMYEPSSKDSFNI